MSRIAINSTGQVNAVAGGGLINAINSVYGGTAANVFLINDFSDFPDAVANVRNLVSGGKYLMQGHITIPDGESLFCEGICSIIGFDSETCSITGNVSGALISSDFSMPLRDVTLANNHASGLNFAIDGNGIDNAYDWFGVNFNGGKVGTIGNVANFNVTSTAVLNASAGFEFTGTVGTASINQSFLAGGTSYAVKVASTATIARRIRLNFCSVIVETGGIGMDISTSATIPNEGYILNTVDFSGAGTYFAGVQVTDDKALFIQTNQENTTAIANMYMKSNSTATVVSEQNARYKIAGTTEISSILQKFTHDVANNAVEYNVTRPRIVRVNMTFSLTGTQNNIIGVYIGKTSGAFAPDANRITESEVYVTASGTRPDAGSCQALVSVAEGDKIYGIVQNTSGTGNITVNFLNMIIERTN